MGNDYDDLSNDLSNLADSLDDIFDLALSTTGQGNSEKKLYLEGRFLAFEEETQKLCVQIEHSTVYYPLEVYNSAWLPFIDDTVHLYRSDDGNIVMVGFMLNGKEIPTAPQVAASIRSYNAGSGVVQVNVDGEFKSLKVPVSIINKKVLKVGSVQLFKQILALPTEYYLPVGVKPEARQAIDIMRMIKS